MDKNPKSLVAHFLEGYVIQSIAMAEKGESRLPEGVLKLHSYSSPKVRHFFNNLCSLPSCSYLEGGCFLGGTTISAAYDNPGRFRALDDYSYHEDVSKARTRLPARLERYKDHHNIEFIEGDLWQTIEKLEDESVNVWFYDAGHTEAETAYAFVKPKRILQPTCIVVVDDYRWPKVRKGVAAGLELGGWKVHRQWEMESPGIKHGGREGWWNGLWIGVLEK